MAKENLNNNNTFLHADEMDWESTDDGVQRKILGYDDHLMMVRVKFERNAIGTAHNHKHRQVTYVEKGRFEVTIDGKKSILKKGDSFFVKQDLVHGVVALEEGILVDVFTPVRQDFL